MGYSKIITYILESEDGTSLKASGWTKEADGVGGGSWDACKRREYYQMSMFEEKPKYSTEKKQRYGKELL